MNYEQFCYKARNVMHENIYTDSEGREILIMRLLDAYSLLTPPRPWVGLTDEEIDSYFEDHGWSPSKDYYPVIKDIEAKLKEKNT